MEEIFNFKLFSQQLQYLVHWKRLHMTYGINEHTWKPTKHLSNAMNEVKKIH
jgi:hypothetical protein